MAACEAIYEAAASAVRRGAAARGQELYEQAAELSHGPERVEALWAAADVALRRWRGDHALRLFAEAGQAAEEIGDSRAATAYARAVEVGTRMSGISGNPDADPAPPAARARPGAGRRRRHRHQGPPAARRGVAGVEGRPDAGDGGACAGRAGARPPDGRRGGPSVRARCGHGQRLAAGAPPCGGRAHSRAPRAAQDRSAHRDTRRRAKRRAPHDDRVPAPDRELPRGRVLCPGGARPRPLPRHHLLRLAARPAARLLPRPLGRGARDGPSGARRLAGRGAAAARRVRDLDRLRRRDPGPARRGRLARLVRDRRGAFAGCPRQQGGRGRDAGRHRASPGARRARAPALRGGDLEHLVPVSVPRGTGRDAGAAGPRRRGRRAPGRRGVHRRAPLRDGDPAPRQGDPLRRRGADPPVLRALQGARLPLPGRAQRLAAGGRCPRRGDRDPRAGLGRRLRRS